MTAALEVTDLSVSFGGLVALDGVSIDVGHGELVGLIGPNGAGKTTLIDAVSGFTSTTRGNVRLGDRPLDDLSPTERARAGLARTFQSVELFEELSVRENLMVSADRPRWWSWLADLVRGSDAGVAARVDDALGLLELEGLEEARPSELSQGQRKLVGVARAFAASPSVLLLDEPAAGLDSKESERLGCQLRAIAEQGIGLLLIDHDMGLVLSACERLHVLDFGREIARGTPNEVRRDPAVTRAYLGEEGRQEFAELQGRGVDEIVLPAEGEER